MHESDINETIRRYNKRLEQFGFTEEALGWTRKNNVYRLNALTEPWIDEIPGSSVFDFGCGMGDLCGFLESKGVTDFTYHGIDINPDLTTEAQKRYPKSTIHTGDIFKLNFEAEYDFVFSSGVFNHKLGSTDEYEFIFSCIDKLYSMTRRGLAINFLSDKTEYATEHNFNSNPGKILEYCYRFTNHILLRNDYMPFEFTVFLRKDKIIDREKLIYQ
jgi:2-polyprenyl-3-methyl-5-hydroxy-6-metoxy-1,4-benzoquinol methylase